MTNLSLCGNSVIPTAPSIPETGAQPVLNLMMMQNVINLFAVWQREATNIVILSTISAIPLMTVRTCTSHVCTFGLANQMHTSQKFFTCFSFILG